MLAIVSTSPYSTSSLDQCLIYADAKTQILLLEDAVYAILPTNFWYKKLIDSGLPIYVLIDDLVARGIETQLSYQVKAIDMAGFVALTEKNATQITW